MTEPIGDRDPTANTNTVVSRADRQVDEIVDLYAVTRDSLVVQLRALSTAHAHTVVPSCPDWTVKDVLAHLAGLVADVLAAVPPPLGSDENTARQVRERREMSLDQICDEWERDPRVRASSLFEQTDGPGGGGFPLLLKSTPNEAKTPMMFLRRAFVGARALRFRWSRTACIARASSATADSAFLSCSARAKSSVVFPPPPTREISSSAPRPNAAASSDRSMGVTAAIDRGG